MKKMKTMLYIVILAGVVMTDIVFASAMSCFKPYNNEWKNCEEQLNLPDTVLNDPVLLPINTGRDELAPTIKNQYLYFIERLGKGQKYSTMRILLSDVIVLGDSTLKETWKQDKEGVDMPGNVYLNFSPDGEMILLNTVDKYNMSKDLFIGNTDTKRKDLKAFSYNGKDYSIGRASVSPDGKRLVFSSDMPGSLGGIDLWMCRFEKGEWSVPENLGEEINSQGDEAMPYFVSNTRLCFASTGYLGFGGYDLFYTDSGEDGFSFPVNMGENVNTEFNEIGICYSPETELFYLASDRRGNYDIYSYKPDIRTEQRKEGVVNSEESGNAELTISAIHQQNDDGNSIDVKIQKGKSVTGKREDMQNDVFYSVQVMALRAPSYSKHRVLQIFGTDEKYFIVREDGWTKFRTGRFNSYENARKYAVRKGIKKFYIVRMYSTQIDEYL